MNAREVRESSTISTLFLADAESGMLVGAKAFIGTPT
jgi:hypothetical protein